MMEILNKFSAVRVLVIGDVMLDRYWWGNVSRISPEAPVPVVQLNRTSTVLGGAANVAANITGLGAKAMIAGGVGTDADGDAFMELLTPAGLDHGLIFSLGVRPTSVKTRVIAHSQQVVRVDQEANTGISTDEEDEVLQRLIPALDAADLIVISDYAKGFLTDRIVKEVVSAAAMREKFVLVDPKGKDFARYKGATLLTPNLKEAADASRIPESSKSFLQDSAGALIEQLDAQAVIVTQGEAGMTVVEKGGAPFHIKAWSRQVYDVTGAGDTVIATLATALAAGAKLRDAAFLANAAAGVVVEKIGTSVITLNSLQEALNADSSVHPAVLAL